MTSWRCFSQIYTRSVLKWDIKNNLIILKIIWQDLNQELKFLHSLSSKELSITLLFVKFVIYRSVKYFSIFGMTFQLKYWIDANNRIINHIIWAERYLTVLVQYLRRELLIFRTLALPKITTDQKVSLFLIIN
jgi:hypothetical protein